MPPRRQNEQTLRRFYVLKNKKKNLAAKRIRESTTGTVVIPTQLNSNEPSSDSSSLRNFCPQKQSFKDNYIEKIFLLLKES